MEVGYCGGGVGEEGGAHLRARWRREGGTEEWVRLLRGWMFGGIVGWYASLRGIEAQLERLKRLRRRRVVGSLGSMCGAEEGSTILLYDVRINIWRILRRDAQLLIPPPNAPSNPLGATNQTSSTSPKTSPQVPSIRPLNVTPESYFSSSTPLHAPRNRTVTSRSHTQPTRNSPVRWNPNHPLAFQDLKNRLSPRAREAK